eukprot:Gb_37859 [translate_table: standard]
MDSDSSPPLFTAGLETATFLASSGLLSKAWEESSRACKTNAEGYIMSEDGDSNVYIAFSSSQRLEDFVISGSRFGECKIQSEKKFFSDSLKGRDDEPALVHQGALKLFLRILENSDFKAKMQILTDPKQRKHKPIVFVGHSLGGAVATLATLWVLEKRQRQSSPFCITFGCPLVGDARLAEAIGREDWAGNFCHVVSKHDIVPRIFLAPYDSIAKPLNAVLPYWWTRMANVSNNAPNPFCQDACRSLVNNVLQYTSTIANYGAETIKEPDGVIKRSPYRPFGTYMFCSNNGAVCVENSEAALKMLHFTMQSQGKPSDEFAGPCILEHTAYGSLLDHISENLINMRRVMNSFPESSYEIGIALEMEAIGVGSQNDHAQLALRKAGEIENKHNMNVAKLAVELSSAQRTMAELEWYKARCEKEGIGYYDSFKLQKDKKDFEANIRRLRLANFWDDIISKVERHELPSDFQSQNKWINAGTAYRRLVEPLDIAFDYRIHKGSGSYLHPEGRDEGRPHRHSILQKWMEEKEKTRNGREKKGRTKLASLTQDSCFWAYLEEALQSLSNLKQEQHQNQVSTLKEKLQKFEEKVKKMIDDHSISSEIFLPQSSFIKWCQEYKQIHSLEWKSGSSLYKFMECEG